MKIPMRWWSDLGKVYNSVRASVYVCLMLIKKMQQLILSLQLFGDKSETEERYGAESINRSQTTKAYHDYFIEDTYEAGISLRRDESCEWENAA